MGGWGWLESGQTILSEVQGSPVKFASLHIFNTLVKWTPSQLNGSRESRERDVVSMLFYFVVIYSTFRVQMVKQRVAHILQG
jgi:hypothetical protein